MAPPLRDLTGETFTRLKVVSFAGYIQKKTQRHAHWRCVCECGNEKIAISGSLLRGTTKSCGCYQQFIRSESHKTHGLSKTIEYKRWRGMLARCNNKNAANYAGYGGRGITVCERWMRSFENFLKDVGLAPTKTHSLDRIDNEKGYFPENCRWATQVEQSRNTISNRNVIHNGMTKSIAQLSEETGLPHHVICGRLNRNWTLEKVLNTPIRKIRRLK